MTRAFAAAAADLLLDSGPLTLDELHALAVERGLTKSKTSTSLRFSLDGEQYLQRPDGRYDTAARLLRDQVFTTRPRRRPDAMLWSYRDLDGLVALPQLPLATGGSLRRGQGAVESWTGPDGWLPPMADGQLLALRWDGSALHLDVLDEVPAGDSNAVRDVREVLGRHARARRPYVFAPAPRTSLTRAVLSALVEDPTLFRSPLPPLRELLPLPEDLRPYDDEATRHDPAATARLVEVPLPLRVHEELSRRAELLAEHLPDYLCLLLGAAADRVQLPPLRYDRYETYDRPYAGLGGDVVQLDAWGR